MGYVGTRKGQLHEIPTEFLASFDFRSFGHITTGKRLYFAHAFKINKTEI